MLGYLSFHHTRYNLYQPLFGDNPEVPMHHYTQAHTASSTAFRCKYFHFIWNFEFIFGSHLSLHYHLDFVNCCGESTGVVKYPWNPRCNLCDSEEFQDHSDIPCSILYFVRSIPDCPSFSCRYVGR